MTPAASSPAGRLPQRWNVVTSADCKPSTAIAAW